MMRFDDLVLVRLIRVADRPDLDADEEDRVQDAHLAHVHAMWQSGVLIAAGPVDDDGDVVGVSIMTCSMDEARRLCDEDPGARAGRFTAELTAWRVPEGMLARGSGRPPASVADVLA